MSVEHVQVSEQVHAAILLRVAARTVTEARRAWKQARGPSGTTKLRAAFRACLLAAKATRRAAAAHGREARAARRLNAEAKRLDAAVADLKVRLAASYAS